MHQQDPDDALRWLSTILWPDGRTTIEPAVAGRRTWWASPSIGDPRILIPADAPAAARRAVRRYHDGFGAGRRAKSLAAELTMAVPGLAAIALRGSRLAQSPTGVGAGGPAGPGVIDALAELLDEPDLVVAIGLSVPKSNRKPVLQLLTPSGRCLGWAKVGWNPISERLVANEASWLERGVHDGHRGRRADDVLVVPELLADRVLADRRVVVTSALEGARWPARPADAPPPPQVFLAVAARGTIDVVPIIESPWWQSVESAMAGATETERNAVDAAVATAAGRRFEVGAWHGDLTPWNLMTVDRRVQVIDWELAADGAPLGFDLCHFHTQVGAEMKGLDAAAALDRSARLSPQGLAALGIDAGNHLTLWRLYLVELVRRMVVLRAQGHPTENLHQGPAALARLVALADRNHRMVEAVTAERVGGR